MPYRAREREFILTDRAGDICGLVRIVQSEDGRHVFHWIPTDGAPPTRVAIPETMRASHFLAAWLDYAPAEGLQLTA